MSGTPTPTSAYLPDRRSDAGLERHFSVNEACKLTGFGRTRIYEFMRHGQLAWVRVGSRRRIPASALAALLESEQ